MTQILARRTSSLQLQRFVPSLVLMATAQAIAFIVRGICWEAVAWTIPIGLFILLVSWRDTFVRSLVTVILAAGLVTVEVVNVGWYHSAWPFGPPHMMVFCGTDFVQSGPVEHASSADALSQIVGGRGPVVDYGVTPSGSEIVGAGSITPSSGCQWQIFVAVANDGWLEYTQEEN